MLCGITWSGAIPDSLQPGLGLETLTGQGWMEFVWQGNPEKAGPHPPREPSAFCPPRCRLRDSEGRNRKGTLINGLSDDCTSEETLCLPSILCFIRWSFKLNFF